MTRQIGLLILLLTQPAFLRAQQMPAIGSAIVDGQEVTYQIRGGYAVIEGDIIIGIVGTSGQIQPDSARIDEARMLPQAAGRIFTSSLPAHWPNGTMYYTIDSDVPNQSRILNAIDHWNTRTPLKILPRSTEPNYVRFERGSDTDLACSSQVGMVGGAQPIMLPDACSTGNTIHEIGHAWGLLHEQSRNDRNANTTVLFENIDKRFVNPNFFQIPPTQDAGYYDFDSIMHYGFRDFSVNGFDTLDSVPLGIPFGQRSVLSAGDIDGISRMYGFIPANTTVTTIPSGLPIVVDGVSGVSPQSFPWAPGSTHSVSVAAEFGTDPLYRVARWSDGGNPTHDVTASAATTVFCATFQRLHLASVAVGSGNGAVSILPATPDGYYPERMPIRITAVPGPGSKLYTWSGASLQSNGTASETANLEVTSANTRFTATFTTQATTTIDSEPRGLVVQVDSGSYLTPVRFLWTSGTAHSVSLTTVQSGPTVAIQNRFSNWQDGNTQASRTVVASASDTIYKATFATRYLLSTTATGPGTVTVSPPSTDGFYDAGTLVQLTGLPTSSVFTLQFWLGDLLGDDPVKTVAMDQPRSVRAGFGIPVSFAALLHAGSYMYNPIFSSATPAVAPGQIVAVFSHNVIGPASPTGGQIQNGKVTTSLAGTRVLFDGLAAPLLYGSQNFLQAIVPSSISGKTQTLVQVERNGVLISGGLFHTVQETFPGIFTSNASGSGQIAAVNEDGSFNSTANPAPSGSIISFYMTGGGLPEKDVPDGQVMGFEPVGLKASVSVRVGKLPVTELRYAASVATLVNGALFVQIRLPKELLGGPAVPVQVIFGNYASPPGTTIAVQ